MGGALIVGNHSGGMLTPDVLIFAAAFYRRFGYRRPLYTLGHDGMFVGPMSEWLGRLGVIRATSENTARALRSGGVVLVFPGGIYDAYRPTLAENVIDFNGRTGYVRSAIDAQVPIVPAVSIGGQESQLFLTRGTWLAKRLGLSRWRSDILPITVGFPFGFSACGGRTNFWFVPISSVAVGWAVDAHGTPGFPRPTPWLTINARLPLFSKSHMSRRQDHG